MFSSRKVRMMQARLNMVARINEELCKSLGDLIEEDVQGRSPKGYNNVVEAQRVHREALQYAKTGVITRIRMA